MKLFEFTPKKNTKKLSTITGLLLLGAAVLMLLTVIMKDMSYRWAVQLLAVGMLVMQIFITTRYMIKGFVYAVIEDDGATDLTVTEISGRHEITVCRIAMSSIERVIVVPQNDRPAELAVKNQIREEKRKIFNYCVDLFADKYICVLSNEGGTPIAIKLSWDESLEKLFEDTEHAGYDVYEEE